MEGQQTLSEEGSKYSRLCRSQVVHAGIGQPSCCPGKAATDRMKMNHHSRVAVKLHSRTLELHEHNLNFMCHEIVFFLLIFFNHLKM